MKKIPIIIILVWLAFQANGQNSGISVTGGIGSYDLSDLKLYQEELAAELPVEPIGFNQFPNFTSLRFNLFKQKTEKFRYGLVVAYSTTGAHSNYTDYSGYINLDQNVYAYQLGISASYSLYTMEIGSNNLNLSGYGDLRLSYIRDEINLNITTNYYYENSSLLLNAVSPLTEAGLDATVRFTNVSLGISGGYLYDVGMKFKPGKSSTVNQTFPLQPAEELHSGMSGFRAGLKLIFWFNNGMISE